MPSLWVVDLFIDLFHFWLLSPPFFA